MKILTVPLITGGASHLIPLFVLQQRYFSRQPKVKNHFLVKASIHQLFQQYNISVVPVDYLLPDYTEEDRKRIAEGGKKEAVEVVNKHRKMVTDMESKAYHHVQPDIVLEDNCLNAPLFSEKYGVPRISIQRTGMFRSLPEHLRNPNHTHSWEKGQKKKRSYDFSEILISDFPDISDPKNRSPLNLSKNYLNPKTKIIPGIPSIEVLPEGIKNKASYFYCGPLTVEDNPTEALIKELNQFFAHNKTKKKVFITMGLVDQSELSAYIDFLLQKGYAVVSSKTVKGIDSPALYTNGFLPLNYICSHVDLVIHHCGSGMYHYPILNEKPTITLGTKCYDREDVGMRLELLGVSKHTPHPDDREDHLSIFESHLNSFENQSLCDFEKLKALKQEVYDTMLNFDIEEVLAFTTS